MILLRERERTFERARTRGVECSTVLVGDDLKTLTAARRMGIPVIEAPNRLGSKYNSGHEWAVQHGYDFSFQTNTDQAFSEDLLVAIASSPSDKIVQTRWLTSVHRNGDRSITTYNPLWAMLAYPTALLRNNPRPCDETLESMCDTGVRQGILEANPGVETHEIEIGPLETIQFESPTQMTSWSRHLKVAIMNGNWERDVPWAAIATQHGEDFAVEMASFYGKTV